MTTKEQIAAAFKNSIRAQLEKHGALFGPDGKPTNMASGWGGEDSLTVIESLCDAAYLGDEPEGFDAIKENVGALVNPSAFRQKLEGKGLVRKGEKGKRNTGVDLLAGI